jgi:orotate phosphoribosyltransferase
MEDKTITKSLIAQDLLKIGAVFLRPDCPFVWASGILSPIYCDNRLTLSAPDVRSNVENGLMQLIQNHFPQCEILMGTSTAGIAHAAITAHLMNLPMGYVRATAKDHGKKNQIEGKLTAGQKTVVVEDLISTAKSSIETVEILRDAGADVLGIVSIFTYGMKEGLFNLEKSKVQNFSLCDFDTLIDVAVKNNYIAQTDKAKLLAFRDNPSDTDWKNK